MVEPVERYHGPTLVPRERLVEALSGFFVRCQTAQQLVVIHEEAGGSRTLCEDIRTAQMLDHLDAQLPRTAPAGGAGVGDAELEEMVRGLTGEVAHAERLQQQALEEAHANWGNLYQQLQQAHLALEQAQAEARQAYQLGERLTQRLNELEGGGAFDDGNAAHASLGEPASPEQITSLQSALREAISEQVQMAQEVAALEGKMIAARSRENTPQKGIGGNLKLRFEGL